MIELVKNGRTFFAHIEYVDAENEEAISALRQRLPAVEISERMVSKSSRLTVAAIFKSVEDRTLNPNIPISAAVSGCSKLDNFSKKLGRRIAIGRAMKSIL